MFLNLFVNLSQEAPKIGAHVTTSRLDGAAQIDSTTVVSLEAATCALQCWAEFFDQRQPRAVDARPVRTAGRGRAGPGRLDGGGRAGTR